MNDLIIDGEVHRVVGPRQKTGARYEITMNYPRTSAFVLATSERQKKIYAELWRKTIAVFDSLTITKSRYIYEYCKSGHVHLHGYIDIELEKFYPVGGIADLVKTYLNLLPKKYQKYIDSKMSAEWARYRDNNICVQYVEIDNKQRIHDWETYINKYQ